MEDPRLTPRKRQILRAIVDAHISHGEPVGSKYLASEALITCSPATIRNEMAELEEMGYLVQPHTSAGRIPSEQGYRYYVDSLVKQYSETKSEIEAINERLRYKLTEMDEILEEASRLAASFTDYTGIAFKQGIGKARITRFDSVYISPRDFLLVMMFPGDTVEAKPVHLKYPISEVDLRRFTEAANVYLVNTPSDGLSMPLIARLEALMGSAGTMVHPAIKVIYETMSELDGADLRFDGINKLLDYPEYSDTGRLKGLLGVLEEKEKLFDVISRSSTDADGINVVIGTESESDAMSNTTLVFKTVDIGGRKISIGVIGPRRMNYSKVISMINGLALGFDKLFGEDAPPGLGDGKDSF